MEGNGWLSAIYGDAVNKTCVANDNKLEGRGTSARIYWMC